MKKIPIMWTVVKMCVIVFSSVATTFIVANLITGDQHEFWFPHPFDEATIFVAINSWTVLYLGSIASAIILVIYSVKIGVIYYRTRQLKRTK